jgi:hypothetical protein
MSKRRVRLEEFELERLKKVKVKLSSQWEEVVKLAEEDQKILKDQRKSLRVIVEAQESAFWHIWRPPPNHPSLLDKLLSKNGIKLQYAFKNLSGGGLEVTEDEIKLLQKSKLRPKIHTSTALNNLVRGCCTYMEFDPLLNPPTLGNPWISNSTSHWGKLESIQTVSDSRDVKQWAYNLEELLMDVTGRDVFERFCRKQHSSENIRFWQACIDLQRIPLDQVEESVKLIYLEFLSSTAESAVNLSADIRKQVKMEAASPHRFSFSGAQKQVLELMRKDIYPRFLKSEDYTSRFTEEQPQSLGKKFLDIFKRPTKSISEPSQVSTQISPLSPGRYSRTKVSVGRRHPMNAHRTTSISSSSSAEDLGKTKDDDPFDTAFIDALTMMQRGRIDSIAGQGTLGRRHSFSHMESVDEGEENTLEYVVPQSVPPAPEQEGTQDRSMIKSRGVFGRKRSMSVGEMSPTVVGDSNSSEMRRRHASGLVSSVIVMYRFVFSVDMWLPLPTGHSCRTACQRCLRSQILPSTRAVPTPHQRCASCRRASRRLRAQSPLLLK